LRGVGCTWDNTHRRRGDEMGLVAPSFRLKGKERRDSRSNLETKGMRKREGKGVMENRHSAKRTEGGKQCPVVTGGSVH